MAYESKRESLLYKFIREKRALTLTQSDQLLGFYMGWTWRSENKFPNYSYHRLRWMHKKYKVKQEDIDEYQLKFPRNIKKYGTLGY